MHILAFRHVCKKCEPEIKLSRNLKGLLPANSLKPSVKTMAPDNDTSKKDAMAF
jgi:hypothetical protein